MSDPQHLRLVEALLFASAKPIDEDALSARLPKEVDVPAVLAELSAIYAERGVNLVRRGDGWAFRTAPDMGAVLAKETIIPRKLPRAAAETLAIVAYHQPVTRAEIEDIRGVSVSQGTLDILFEAGWVTPQGRKEGPGRPMLWATTPTFLDHFGLKSLDDLPGLDELRASGLLDANPALPTYAARARDGDAVGVDEPPVEPLDAGDEAAEIEHGVSVAAEDDGRDAPEAEPNEAEDLRSADAVADHGDERVEEDEAEAEAEAHGGANGGNGRSNGGHHNLSGGNGSNGGHNGNGGYHALGGEEDLERSALADAILNTAVVEAEAQAMVEES